MFPIQKTAAPALLHSDADAPTLLHSFSGIARKVNEDAGQPLLRKMHTSEAAQALHV